MSTCWDIWCRDCDVGFGFDWKGEEDLLKLIAGRDELARLAKLNMREGHRAGGYEIRVSTWFSEIDLSLFAQHAEHTLVLKNEYGEFSDACNVSYRCGSCDTPLLCKRAPKHAGPHSRFT